MRPRYSDLEKRKSFMKRATILTVLVMSACDDPSFPPEACVVLLDKEELFIGEQETVALCFQDPDGDAITVEATASDPSVVEAEVQSGGRAVLLTGRDAGQAVITVVARDSNGLSAAPQTFTVTVPNRAPEAMALPDIMLSPDAPEASLILTKYFTDPDGHPLTFSAAVSDETVIGASVTDNINLEVERVGRGSALVRVTATDPHGLSASGQAEVHTVVELLNDEFNVLSDHWDLDWGPTAASIVEGRLRLSSSKIGLNGVGLARVVLPEAEDWSVEVNTESMSDSVWPGIVVETAAAPLDGASPLLLTVLIGADQRSLFQDDTLPRTNFVVALLDAVGWIVDPEYNGWSDEIAGPGTAQNVTVSLDEQSLTLLVDDALIRRVPRAGRFSFLSAVRSVFLAAWTAPSLQSLGPSEATYWDWITVQGFPTGASAAAQGALPHPADVRLIR